MEPLRLSFQQIFYSHITYTCILKRINNLPGSEDAQSTNDIQDVGCLSIEVDCQDAAQTRSTEVCTFAKKVLWRQINRFKFTKV